MLKALTGKLVTVANPESTEGAPVGKRLTTGFYKAKIKSVMDDMVVVATEFAPHRSEVKEPVKQFIPIQRIKRVSVMKDETVLHL